MPVGTRVVTGTLSLQKTNPAIAIPGIASSWAMGTGPTQPTVATVFIAFNDQDRRHRPDFLPTATGSLNFGTSKDMVGDLIFNGGGKINVGAISGRSS